MKMPKVRYCIDCGKKCQGERCRNCRKPWNKGKKFVHKGSFKKGHKAYSGSGEKNSNWKGGRHINSHGYVEIRDSIKKKYYLEHIKVVETFIKRTLKKSEVIHHINEIKTDNRIENLMIFPNPSAHKSFHTKIRQFGFTTPILKQIEKRWKK